MKEPEKQSEPSRSKARIAAGQVQRATVQLAKEKGTEAVNRQLKKLKDFGDRDAVGLHALLTVLSRQSSDEVRKGLSEYLNGKVAEHAKRLINPAETFEPIDYMNIRLLMRLQGIVEGDFKTVFTNRLKNENADVQNVVMGRLLSNQVMTLQNDRKALKSMRETSEGEIVNSVDIVFKVRDFLTPTNKAVETPEEFENTMAKLLDDISELSLDDSARKVLINELKSQKYSDQIYFDGILKIIDSTQLDGRELLELMIHYSDHNETWGTLPEDEIRTLLRVKIEEYKATNSHEASTLENLLDNFDEGKRKAQESTRIEKWIKPLVGFGLKTEDTTDRFAAVTGNAFQDTKGNVTVREMLAGQGAEMKLWQMKDNKIAKIRWSQALNPLVLLNYGLRSVEILTQRATYAAFGDNKILRGIIQAPVALIVRVPSTLLHIANKIITLPFPSEDTGKDEKAQLAAEAELSKERMQEWDEDVESIESVLTPRSASEEPRPEEEFPAVGLGNLEDTGPEQKPLHFAESDEENEAHEFTTEELDQLAEDSRISQVNEQQPEAQASAAGTDVKRDQKGEWVDVPLLSGDTPYGPQEVSHSVQYEPLSPNEQTINALQEQIDNQLLAVNDLNISDKELEDSYQEQLNHELNILKQELSALSQGVPVDEALLEKTGKKLTVLQNRMALLVRSENDLNRLTTQEGTVDRLEESQLKNKILKANEGLQNTIDDLREINLIYEDNRGIMVQMVEQGEEAMSNTKPKDRRFQNRGGEPGDAIPLGDYDKATGSYRDSGTTFDPERESASKKTGIAGLWETVRQTWRNTTVRLRGASAGEESEKGVDAGAVRGVSEGVEKAEFSQVRFVGGAENFKGENRRRNFDNWRANPNYNLTVREGGFENPPIIFSGGQSIEVRGNDVVMRGFTPEVYASFRENFLKDIEPQYRVSAANSDLYTKVDELVGDTVGKKKGKGDRNLLSRLTSVGLFFQKQWSDAKAWVTGTSPSSTTSTKSEPTPLATEAAGEDRTTAQPGPESTPPSFTDASKPDSTPLVRESTREAQVAAKPTPTPNRVSDDRRATMLRQPTSENVRDELEKLDQSIFGDVPLQTFAPRAPVPHPPNNTEGNLPPFVRVKVTVKSEYHLDDLRGKIVDYATTQALTVESIDQTADNRNLSVVLKAQDEGGVLRVSAAQGAKTLVIEEQKHTEKTPGIIAHMAYELPKRGEKAVTVSGKVASLREAVTTALTEKGHSLGSQDQKENQQENQTSVLNRGSGKK